MKFFRRHKSLLIACIAAVLVLAMAIASLFASGRVSPASDLLGSALRPLQTLVSGMANGVGGLWGYIYEYDQLLAENEELRLRLARQEEDIRRLEQNGEENEQLKELLGIHEARPDFQFVSADIIARDMSNWARVFTLDKGRVHGVETGNCVISAEGYLVGVVTQAAANWCEVTTLIDTDMNAGAKVYRTSLTAVAEGDFDLMLKGRLGLFYLKPDVDLSIGDVVLTSGIGGVLPKDVPIGIVVDVRQEKDGMSAMAELEPKVQLDRLKVCYIVTSFSTEDGGGAP